MSQPLLALVAKAKSPLLTETLRSVIPPFLARGWHVIGDPILASAWDAAGFPRKGLSLDPSLGSSGPAPELCLALGGDGTLLAAARAVGFRGTPLLGINLGSLGFLTAHHVTEARDMVEAFFQDKLRREQRGLLHVQHCRGDHVLADQLVLNDAVLAKGALARIMEFHLRVDGREAALIRADGLIVATPTGSTAYSLSAGGPILHPALDAWVISPICPHSLTLRPTVVPSELLVCIQLVQAEDAHLTLDGQVGHAVTPGDRIELSRSERKVVLLQNPEMSFFPLLQQKLLWSHR